METHKDLYAYAVKLLAMREYAAKALHDKLSQKSDTASADAVLLYLQTKGYQSDVRYVESYCRYRANLGFGPNHIQQSLRQKGVNDADIALGFDAAAVCFDEVLCKLIARKYPEPESDFKAKQKRIQFLVGRGFSFSVVKRAVML